MAIFGPDSDKVLSQGEQATGVVTGIRVDYSSDNAEHTYSLEHYAVDVGGKTFGIRQTLSPDDYVRLGMTMTLRVLGDAAVIDWPATLATAGLDGDSTPHRWKMLKDPPAAGIVDELDALKKAKKKGLEGTARVDSIGQRSVVFGLASVTDFEAVVDLAGQEAYLVTIKKVNVPCYATHLERQGIVLPVWVHEGRLDKVVIDWPAAAMKEPGVGQPPASPHRAAHAVTAMSFGSATVDVREQIASADNGEVVGGITLSTLVAVEVGLIRDRIAPAGYDDYARGHGVAPGTWATASAAWHQRMMSDWRVGAAYGEAYSDAMDDD